MLNQNKPSMQSGHSASISADVDRQSQDLGKFQESVLVPYLKGQAEQKIAADSLAARSLVPPCTGCQRSFAYIGSEIPKFIAENCVGCMECVIACPDVAISSRTVSDQTLQDVVSQVEKESLSNDIKSHFVQTTKHGKVLEKKGKTPGLFSIWIDPDRCKGCGECVEVCGKHEALAMVPKSPELLDNYRKLQQFVGDNFSNNPDYYMNDSLKVDMFMNEQLRVNRGGSGSCTGCGEVTAINIALTATAKHHGKNFSIVAATGCNTVYSSTYPFNIFEVPWTNSLFENAPTVAMGVRLRMNQQKRQDSKLWVIGGDGAMFDIGFQSLSRLLTSNMDINVLVLDTQVYSNTGGQASTASYMGQDAEMSYHGSAIHGKPEKRKELGMIAMQHPDVFVAQVSQSHLNHFITTIEDAVSYPGPSLIIAYTACMPEHGIDDDVATQRARAAVTSRAFPLYVYDPRRGNSIAECLSLKGNPAMDQDWAIDIKTNEPQDFVWFARQEGRFRKHFDKDGNASEALQASQADRLGNWHRLQELAGIDLK